MVRYAYFPGCVGQDSCKELDVSTKLVAAEIGLDLEELTEATCCGAGFVQDVDYDLATVLNARTLAMAEARGLDLMTVCSTCQYNLQKANVELKRDPERLAMANRHLAEVGLRYSGNVKVKHLLQILVEDIGLETIRSRVRVDLGELNIGSFYGCQLLRPSDILGWENADHPESFERVIVALGAKPVYYKGRTKCCGFPITFVNEKASMTMNFRNMREAVGKGADALATSCPLCHINLDMYQRKAEGVGGEALDLPILHLPQLVGLAFGIPAKELGLRRHFVPTDVVVERVREKGAVAQTH
jgi:succinate dehydrogenase / fumarate reductase cytochrome b subunit